MSTNHTKARHAMSEQSNEHATTAELVAWSNDAAANHEDWSQWFKKNPEDPRSKINGDTAWHKHHGEMHRKCAASLTAKDAEIERLTRERDKWKTFTEIGWKDNDRTCRPLNALMRKHGIKWDDDADSYARSIDNFIVAILSRAESAESTVASLGKELDALKNGIRLDRLEAHDAGSYRIAYLDTKAVAALSDSKKNHAGSGAS